MKALPWIVAVASIALTAFLYSSNQKLKAELASSQSAKAELTKIKSENEELKRLESLEPELDRLKKETAEVYKLRNEIRQLKQENQQLASSQGQQQQPAPEVAQNDATIQDLMNQLNGLRAENEALKKTVNPQAPQQNVEEMLAGYRDACIQNLRQLDGASEQWALENKKGATDVPDYEALLAYLPNPPACPQGGSYTIGAVGRKPTCNMPDHKIPE